ncbi:glycosyl transferase family 90-domain-containing protein [Crepidotus variabilis]|uniref:Glycosyl transferase family 90-domain-containing protein n=1 Tax=Crepidotus variabilis TaxID=179855 RepID=A0A9P6JSX2_9AGAR|nr:glycosyl transferase family 90-domain-containing protein [Crepidotus variabilis]
MAFLRFLRRRTLFRVFLGAAALYILLYGLPDALVRHSAEPAPVKKQPQYIHPTAVNFSAFPPPPPPTRKPLLPPPPPPPPPVLGKHRYRKDGLVEVNEEGPHPIYELIARAEKEWSEKLGRASTTLKEAVEEYQRRYKRMPPKGFNLWWNYASKHNVQLPDEYDTIFHDLEPFWGLDPEDLHKIQAEAEKKIDSYTVGKNETEGNIGVLTYTFSEGRYDQLIVGSKEIIKLFQQIQDVLPLFRMTISPHDGPNRLTDHGIMQAVLKAAASGTYLKRSALPKKKELGWVSACPPTSLARQNPIDLDNPPPWPTKKTFIYNHAQTMNPCDHPDLFHHHGQFLSHNSGPGPQDVVVPEFSYCSTVLHHNIRFPVPYGWVEDILPRSDDPPFEEKLDERLLWRGSNTGMFHSSTSRWEHSHRDFLVAFSNDLSGKAKVLNPVKSVNEQVGVFKEFKRANLNPALLDIAFAGQPLACSASTCDTLRAIYPWREYQSLGEAGQYKYVLDVDGNGWSGRFKRLITSNSLIFKSTIYPEWFVDRVQPWVHYVPVQVDLSDLHDSLLFFRGDPNGDGAHEDLARKIAHTGRLWSKTFWRKEDLISYLFRLTLEFARLLSDDRDAMTYRL